MVVVRCVGDEVNFFEGASAHDVSVCAPSCWLEYEAGLRGYIILKFLDVAEKLFEDRENRCSVRHPKTSYSSTFLSQV
jgi:hypothetical protein